MVGESDTVSRGFTAARNGLIWIGGFVAVFTVIFVVAMTFDSNAGKQVERLRVRGLPRTNNGKPAGDEPSMGLSPETANPQESTN